MTIHQRLVLYDSVKNREKAQVDQHTLYFFSCSHLLFLTDYFILSFWIENINSAEDKENADSLENQDTFDTGVLAGMAETIAICWGGIKDKLDKVHSVDCCNRYYK